MRVNAPSAHRRQAARDLGTYKDEDWSLSFAPDHFLAGPAPVGFHQLSSVSSEGRGAGMATIPCCRWPALCESQIGPPSS